MLQLGLGMEFTDPETQELVPWSEFNKDLVKQIEAAPWKVVDIETSGLTPQSEELKFSGRELRRGVNPKLRLRVCSILIPTPSGVPTGKARTVIAFDFDKLSAKQREAVCKASLTNVFIGFNAGFDLYWLRTHSKQIPSKVLDVMLLARLLVPEVPIKLAEMANNDLIDFELKKAAENVFMARRSGWSLADLTLVLFNKILPKGMQGPKNWCQPFLSQEAYNYATGDVTHTLDVCLKIMGLEVTDEDSLLAQYELLSVDFPAIKIVEPQVMDIVYMREHGMPWVQEVADKYVAAQKRRVRRYAKVLVGREAAMLGEDARLGGFLDSLASFDDGISAKLKEAIGNTFMQVGIEVDVTDNTGSFKIGEKDLRKAKAALHQDAIKLFAPWVAINRAKRAGKMAREVTAYMLRSGDGRLHPLTGHGPVTGRLSSSEPNCQQFPRDQMFRDGVTAKPGHSIVASDYSALDMRVGAALAIRAQLQILDVFRGKRKAPRDVKAAIELVHSGKYSVEQAQLAYDAVVKEFTAHKAMLKTEEFEGMDRKQYWEVHRALARQELISRFTLCLQEVKAKADEAGEETWGSLRNAFKIKDMDIHTWTTLGMLGIDPATLTAGKSEEEIAKILKVKKKELGSKRMTGKVGNLALLYAMGTLGLLDYAAKNHNLHWTYEEADEIRIQWLKAYVEINLWHAWTELNDAGYVYVPDPDKGGKAVRKNYYRSITLGGRNIFAFGLNAALSYEDQSTGADILGTAMNEWRSNYPEIFACVVNQVHDEVVFEIPDELVTKYTDIIAETMNAAAEKFLMVYGVHAECSPAIGKTWLKE